MISDKVLRQWFRGKISDSTDLDMSCFAWENRTFDSSGLSVFFNERLAITDERINDSGSVRKSGIMFYDVIVNKGGGTEEQDENAKYLADLFAPENNKDMDITSGLKIDIDEANTGGRSDFDLNRVMLPVRIVFRAYEKFLLPPINTVSPIVSGTSKVGETLSTTNGTWAQNPTSYTYQWQSDGVNIAGATSNTFVLTISENETDVRCVVTATNADGSTSANSNAVAVTLGPPVNTVAPVASGVGEVGETLSTTNGTWLNSPTSYTYQWQSDGIDIVGATSNTFILTSDEGGTDVRCVVTATNDSGSVSANSNAIAVAPDVSYLLDTYPAFAAYSTRQLSSTAINCMDVRESSGSTVATIGFSGGWLDEAAVATHCGANNGFVSKWYDQSGNTRDASQATAIYQPQIYNGSAVITLNTKPSMQKQSSSSALKTANFGSQSQPNTYFTVCQYTSGVTANMIGGLDTSNRNLLYYASSAIRLLAGTNLVTAYNGGGSQRILTALFNTTSSIFRSNGNQEGSGNVGTQAPAGLTLMNQSGLSAAVDYLQEAIMYASDQTANFAAIESDINTAFSVYA